MKRERLHTKITKSTKEEKNREGEGRA